ncbi:hypothetical protein B0H13DRAFT_1707276 [Mycena leptocephala]|nr:hypothetical protein B0H13DRAFT_1707276 [Mycena leptocephala]
MPAGHPYSGAELRIRDKAIEEKYSKEIAALEAKVQRLRYAFDDRSNEYFDSVHYGNKIADLLGFRSLKEVQTFVELADEQVPYKELAKRLDELKAELASAKLSGSSVEALAKELVDLQARLNAVSERADRADGEFKDRMVKWRVFKQWMQNEEKQYKDKRKGLRATEKIRHRDAYYLTRRQKMKEMGLDSDEDPLKQRDQQHQFRTSSARLPHRHFSAPQPSSPLAAQVQQRMKLESGFQSLLRPAISRLTKNCSCSSLPPLASLTFANNIPAKPQENDAIGTSFLLYLCSLCWTFILVIDCPPASTRTTQNLLPAPHPTLPIRPNFPQFGGGEITKKQRQSDVFPARHVRPDSENAEQERPRKIRRFSSPVRTPLAVIPTTGVLSSRDGVKASSSTSRGRENRVDRQPTSTPANTSGSKQLTDYSAFKGRGRYGKTPAGNDTINASYAIDPARNGGVDFQYDAVVRGKEDRRRMEGGDCECCRDYYEAIGPLPSRLQPPLWRSPPNSPEKRKPCRNGGRDDSITSHKQAISRHRHNWAQGSTPPSYWNIGFPNTQEAKDINERAAEMHKQKMRKVQEEAENGGRYYKTR